MPSARTAAKNPIRLRQAIPAAYRLQQNGSTMVSGRACEKILFVFSGEDKTMVGSVTREVLATKSSLDSGVMFCAEFLSATVGFSLWNLLAGGW